MLRYPRERITRDYDYLEIQIVQYVPPGLGSFSSQNSVFQAPTGTDKNLNPPASRIIETIQLPMPAGISDGNSVNWTEDRLNVLASAGLAAGNKALENNKLNDDNNIAGAAFNTAKEFVGNTFQILGDLAGDETIRDAGKDELLRRAVNSLGANVDARGLLSRAQGKALNPNLELLFRGVNLRSFNFNFTMTPRSQDESNEIKRIIRAFKQNQAAKNTASSNSGRGVFIAAPNVFNLEYKRGANKHPFLNSFKTLALKNIGVNYAAQGRYVTYEDASPLQLTLALSFTELNPIYSEDYDDLPLTDGVGF